MRSTLTRNSLQITLLLSSCAALAACGALQKAQMHNSRHGSNGSGGDARSANQVTEDEKAPVVESGDDPVVYLSDTVAKVEMAAADPDGLDLSYSWSLLQGPGEVTFSQPAALATEVKFSVPGVYKLRMVADNGITVGADDMRIVVIDDRPAWFKKPGVLRERYVSSTGTGSGQSPEDPMSADAAYKAALPGDLFWFAGGTYKKGAFADIKVVGTAQNPIIYRAAKGERVTIEGAFRLDLTSRYVWIWGFEITDPTGTATGSDGISLFGEGARAINDVVYRQFEKNGIGAWNRGSGQVTYGNIIYENGNGTNHPHGIYTQNDYNQYGMKYFVNNIVADRGCCGGTNFHGYTEQGLLSGFHIEKNVFANGQFLLGGFNDPHHHNVIFENHIMNTAATLGWRRPIQAEFRDNILTNAQFQSLYMWGQNFASPEFVKPLPNVYTGNTFYGTSSMAIKVLGFSGSSYPTSQFDPADIVNSNSYTVGFGGNAQTSTTPAPVIFNGLPEWQAFSGANGAGFDKDSIVRADSELPRISVHQNVYEPERLHIYISNGQLAKTVKVDLGDYIPYQYEYRLHDFKGMWDEPLIKGLYEGPISVDMDGKSARILVAVVGKPRSRPSGRTPFITLRPPPGPLVAGAVVEFAAEVENAGVRHTKDLDCSWQAAGASIDAPTDKRTDMTFPAFGQYEVEFSCTDVAERKASRRVMVDVIASPNKAVGLFSEFKFDGVLTDSLSKTGELVTYGAPTFAAGKVDEAIVFNGTSDYLKTTTPFANLKNDFSIIFWMNTTGTGPVIGNNGGGTSAGIGHMLYIYDDNGKLRYSVSEGINAPCNDSGDIVFGPKINDGIWHHVGLTYEKSRNLMRLYVDGFPYSQKVLAEIDPQCISSMNKIGGGFSYSNTPKFFNGMMDELRIYDRVISDAQVRAAAKE